jgi:hypothetical protein
MILANKTHLQKNDLMKNLNKLLVSPISSSTTINNNKTKADQAFSLVDKSNCKYLMLNNNNTRLSAHKRKRINNNLTNSTQEDRVLFVNKSQNNHISYNFNLPDDFNNINMKKTLKLKSKSNSSKNKELKPKLKMLISKNKSVLSSSLASLLKRQKAKSTLTLNSTEIDQVNQTQADRTEVDNMQLYASLCCSTCQNKLNCEYCLQSTMIFHQKSGSTDSGNCHQESSSSSASWMLNSTNFLSSTPAYHEEELINPIKSKERKRASKRAKKTEPVAVKKAKISSSEKVSKKQKTKSKDKFKILPRTSSTLIQKYDFKFQQQLFLNSCMPQSFGAPNSNENFTNLGDFLVWYV